MKLKERKGQRYIQTSVIVTPLLELAALPDSALWPHYDNKSADDDTQMRYTKFISAAKLPSLCFMYCDQMKNYISHTGNFGKVNIFSLAGADSTEHKNTLFLTDIKKKVMRC